MCCDPFRVDGKVCSQLQAMTPQGSKIAGFVISEGSPTVESFRIMFDPDGIRAAVPLDPEGSQPVGSIRMMFDPNGVADMLPSLKLSARS